MANKKVTKDESNKAVAIAILGNFYLNKLDRLLEAHATDHDKVVVKGSNLIPLRIGDHWWFIDTDTNVSTATDMDAGAVSNGKDYYVYACDDGSNNLVFKISLNSTVPTGFDAAHSRKIGGFHTLCVNVGTIASHSLSDYNANDILPASIWDLKHRAVSSNAGMVYDSAINKWVDIYLASGTGASTASVYLGTISDVRNWMDFVDDGHAVDKRLAADEEFQSFAAGSNEETNIAGGADPGTTGGHSDAATPARRMISNIGCEDCAGVMWQWLLDQSYRYDAGTHSHTVTITHKAVATGSVVHKDQAETNFNAVCGSGANETVNTSSVDPVPGWAWHNLPAPGRGSLFRQGTYGDVKLLAGGSWSLGTACGSRCRTASDSRWSTHASIGARFLAEPRR